ncbi:hypothetical protein IP88_00900, partial [alpha proteobacterium AAP81b]
MAMRVLLAFLALGLPAAAAASAPTGGHSARHDYVLGRYAASDDQLGLASRLFDDAQRRDPAAPALRRRAFDLAVAAGDRPRATALAAELNAAASGKAGPEVAMITLVDAVLRRDWPAVDVARGGLKDAGFVVVVAPVVEAWARFGRGDRDGALARLDPANFTGFPRGYVAEQRAHMLAAIGRWPEAAKLYAEIRVGSPPGINFARQGEA